MRMSKKLFRVDLNLKYLFYTDKTILHTQDVLKWLEKDCHSGELDDDDTCVITEIDDPEDVDDFPENYTVYSDDKTCEINLGDIFKTWNTPEAMVAKLKKMGYKITPPKK